MPREDVDAGTRKTGIAYAQDLEYLRLNAQGNPVWLPEGKLVHSLIADQLQAALELCLGFGDLEERRPGDAIRMTVPAQAVAACIDAFRRDLTALMGRWGVGDLQWHLSGEAGDLDSGEGTVIRDALPSGLARGVTGRLALGWSALASGTCPVIECGLADCSAALVATVSVSGQIVQNAARFLEWLLTVRRGRLPFDLIPVQVRFLLIDAASRDYARSRQEALAGRFRTDLLEAEGRLRVEVKRASLKRIPFIGIIGARERRDRVVNVRMRGRGELGAMSQVAFLKLLEGQRTPAQDCS